MCMLVKAAPAARGWFTVHLQCFGYVQQWNFWSALGFWGQEYWSALLQLWSGSQMWLDGEE